MRFSNKGLPVKIKFPVRLVSVSWCFFWGKSKSFNIFCFIFSLYDMSYSSSCVFYAFWCFLFSCLLCHWLASRCPDISPRYPRSPRAPPRDPVRVTSLFFEPGDLFVQSCSLPGIGPWSLKWPQPNFYSTPLDKVVTDAKSKTVIMPNWTISPHLLTPLCFWSAEGWVGLWYFTLRFFAKNLRR